MKEMHDDRRTEQDISGCGSIVQTMLAADMDNGMVTSALITEKVEFVVDNLYPEKTSIRKRLSQS
jgi:hypothetical protein